MELPPATSVFSRGSILDTLHIHSVNFAQLVTDSTDSPSSTTRVTAVLLVLVAWQLLGRHSYCPEWDSRTSDSRTWGHRGLVATKDTMLNVKHSLNTLVNNDGSMPSYLLDSLLLKFLDC